MENIDIWKIETAQSFKVLFDSWNCRANVSCAGFARVMVVDGAEAERSAGLVEGYDLQTIDQAGTETGLRAYRHDLCHERVLGEYLARFRQRRGRLVRSLIGGFGLSISMGSLLGIIVSLGLVGWNVVSTVTRELTYFIAPAPFVLGSA